MKFKNKYIRLIAYIIIFLYLIISSNAFSDISKQIKKIDVKNINNYIDDSSSIKINYINVKEADAVLIQKDNANILIDSGSVDSTSILEKYLDDNNVKKINYVFLTHPHEDHIGGISKIIDNYDVKNVYMSNAISTSKSYSDLLDSLSKKNMSYNISKEKDIIEIDGLKLYILSSKEETSDLNDSSLVIKLVYKNNSFLFCGDATDSVLKDILNKDIKSDVLMIPHHGSYLSFSKEFINSVNPKYSIISVGKNNYGHPSEEIISFLNENNIKIYRTDIHGNIVFKSDGKNISVTTELIEKEGEYDVRSR